jgi:hypothetical protein
MTLPFFFLLLLAVPDGGVLRRSEVQGLAAELAVAAEDAVPRRRPLRVQSVSGGGDFADVESGASTTVAAPRPRPAPTPAEPTTRVAVREPSPGSDLATPPAPDSGVADTTGGGAETGGTHRRTRAALAGVSDPAVEALLEQSRTQTEALQTLVSQQQAAEQARVADQQARYQRVLALEDARGSIEETVQALQTSGNWNPETLDATSAALRRTAAAASAAASGAEAARIHESASLIDAAQAAAAQHNGQQAQWYLTRAAQLLGGSAPAAGRGY